MAVYYNEFDKQKAVVIRELISEGVIADGEVDTRSIVDVRADDLRGFTQCHFFAGGGIWSYALRLAGWDDDWPIWTGSCPCQPFSVAGKRKGKEDSRHLWPEFLRLIRDGRPLAVIGEQVASPDAVRWFDGSSENVQALRDQQAVFGVLREFQRAFAFAMHGMYESGDSAAKAPEPGKSEVGFQNMEGEKPRACTCYGSQAQGQTQGHGIRSGLKGNPETNQQRQVRTNRDTFLPGRAESMECSVAGSDQLLLGLHDGKREGCPLCGKCDGEHMGAPEDCGDLVGDFESPAHRNRAAELLSSRSAEASDPELGVNSVRSDMEGIGYSCWATITPACGYGAPHIRQRLYWGARMDDEAGIGRDGRRASGFRDTGGLSDTYGVLTEQFTRQWAGPTEASRGRPCDQLAGPGDVGGVEHAEGNGREQRGAESGGRGTAGGCGSGGVGVAHGERFAQRVRGPVNGFWSGADWVLVRPQRLGDSLSIRPVNRATFPLAPGTPGRVLGLRVAGDAINAEQAAAFIRASWELLK